MFHSSRRVSRCPGEKYGTDGKDQPLIRFFFCWRRPPSVPFFSIVVATETEKKNRKISTRGSVEETSLDVDKRVMDVNYFGAVSLAKGLLEACAPPLPTRAGEVGGQAGPNGGGGWAGSGVRFIIVNSVQGKFGMAFRSSYAASKHALVGFFDCLRAERAQQGIGVLSVFPGYVRTRCVHGVLLLLLLLFFSPPFLPLPPHHIASLVLLLPNNLLVHPPPPPPFART